MQKPKTQGTRLLRELFLRGKQIYTFKEIVAAAEVQKVASKQLKKILANLAKRDRLLRLKRGLYATVATLPELTQPHPFAIATKLITPSAISHASALHYHGFIEEAPARITAITTKRVASPVTKSIRGFEYKYKHIPLKEWFGVEKVLLNQEDSSLLTIPITNKERTLLDLLVHPTSAGGKANLLKIIEKALPALDPEKLLSYAELYGKKSVLKRVQKILQKKQLPER